MKKNNPIFLLISITLIFFYLILISLPYPFSLSKQISFSIRKGQSLKEVSLALFKEKVIFSPSLFIFYFKLNNLEKNIKAGDYLINLPISLKELAKKITSNEIDNVFLIKEGETLKEIEKNLKEKGILKAEEDLKNFKLKDFPELVSKFKLEKYEEKPLEGFLYPDSYHLPKGLTAYEILNIFLDNFSKKVDSQLFKKTNEYDFYEILTLASLIEKEVKTNEEKRMVADILLRRLNIKMPLQVDATICYALNQEFNNCQLKKEDFKIDSLYNTYLYFGLPPTPISNPSKETIEAVLNPLKNDFWYYLTERKTGKTYFSKTLEEHEIKREKYL